MMQISLFTSQVAEFSLLEFSLSLVISDYHFFGSSSLCNNGYPRDNSFSIFGNQTKAFDSDEVHGTKNNKDTITIVALISASGQKLPLIFINPSIVLMNMRKKHHCNMQVIILWNTQIRKQKEANCNHLQIIMLNKTNDVQSLRVRHVFFPPNCTSRYQQLDLDC